MANPNPFATRPIRVTMRCTSCGHVQQVNGVQQKDGTQYLGSGAVWCDECNDGKPELIDPQSDSARLARHRDLHSPVHPDVAAAAESARAAALDMFKLAATQRDQAIAHLHALLNQRRTATQMQEAERAAREWLESIGSEPT